MAASQLFRAPGPAPAAHPATASRTAPVPSRAPGIMDRLALDDSAFETRMTEALAAVEKHLLHCVDSAPDPRIAALTRHLAAAGGKRLRPLLVLLAAEFGDPWRDGVTQAAVVVELVHIASLHHDDVMDAAAIRHGVPSVNALWGERLAVQGGDWLLARAAQLAAVLGPDAVRINADTAGRLVSGQLRELTGPAPGEDPVDHYVQVTAGKTAALLAMALRTGALQSATTATHARALGAYGEHLGIAFQIADDLLDLAAPASLTGKEHGKDILAGVPSLPVVLARRDDRPGGAELRELLTTGNPEDPAVHRRALELFRTSPVLGEAAAFMHRRLDRARSELDALPPLPARRALRALCDYVAHRTS